MNTERWLAGPACFALIKVLAPRIFSGASVARLIIGTKGTAALTRKIPVQKEDSVQRSSQAIFDLAQPNSAANRLISFYLIALWHQVDLCDATTPQYAEYDP